MSLFKKSRTVLFMALFTIITLIAAYKVTYKAHDTMDDLVSEFAGKASEFVVLISDDQLHWNGSVVELSGKITELHEKGIQLEQNIYCLYGPGEMKTDLHTGQYITIRGRVIGYDDLLEELKLDKAIILK